MDDLEALKNLVLAPYVMKATALISNLTDLHRDTHTDQKISDYLDQTEQFVIPMARQVNADMVIELTDIVAKRRELLKMMK